MGFREFCLENIGKLVSWKLLGLPAVVDVEYKLQGDTLAFTISYQPNEDRSDTPARIYTEGRRIKNLLPFLYFDFHATPCRPEPVFGKTIYTG